MQKLGDEINQVIRDLAPDAAAVVKATLVHTRFADAVRREYGDRAAAFILSHVQAVYVMRDDTHATAEGYAPVIMRVYTDDSVVRSDLDARQESLKLKLLPAGVRFDRLKVYQSTFGMRQRDPFREVVDELRQTDAQRAADQAQRKKLTLSRNEVQEILDRVEDSAVKQSIEQALSAFGADV